MNAPDVVPRGGDAAYWHERVRAEARAALACDDPHIAAIHVELATRCLQMAQQQASAPAVMLPPA